MNTPKKILALMIDGDNAQLSNIKPIIQFCEGYGTLKIKRAYGDWNKPPLSAHKQTITALGVKCVQQNRVGKNATDIRLVMNVSLILDKREADIYFIVSSDGDYTVLCEQIRQKGAKVIGIGSKSHTSSTLRKACNEFYYVEEIVENQSKPPPKPAAVPKPKNTTTLNMLIRAYQKTPQKNGWVLLTQLREVLRQHDQHFEKRFAGKRISTWLKDFPHRFEVAGDRVRMR